MIDELIESYTNKMTFFNMVTKNNKGRQNALTIGLLVLALTGYALMFLEFLAWYGMAACVFLFAAGKLSKVFNIRTFKRLYPEYFQPNLQAAFNSMISEKFEEQMKNKTWDDKKWDMLQAAIINEAEKKRMFLVVYLSAAAALFLPLWAIYVVKMMDRYGKPPFGDLTYGFLTMVVLIACMALVPIQIIWMRDNVLSKYERMTTFNKLITDFRLLA